MKQLHPILICGSRRIALTLLLLFIVCATQLSAVPFIVTTTVDNGNNVSPTAGSLRAAIISVNAAVSTAINFNIPPSDPGYNASNNTWSIQPPSDLPNIENTVTIDGYTQPGSSVNTLAQGDNAVLTIILNGSNYTVGDGLATGNGLHFAPLANTSVDNSVVRGLVINQWLDNGILLDTVNANIISVSIIGCFIGTDASGTQQMANRTGIGLSGLVNTCVHTIIGTSAFADRNIIAGSFSSSVTDNYGIQGSCIYSFFNAATVIKNNYIGIDKTGTIALNNSLIGITYNDDHSSIGGSTSAERNIVSGHLFAGIRFLFATNCTIQGNYIGTDFTGTQALGNGFAGICLNGQFFPSSNFNNTIVSNLVSGNRDGIVIGSHFPIGGAVHNTVQGNLIGTDASGTKALGNTRYGIVLNSGQNTIGGTTAAARNIIAGNGQDGVLIYSNTATSNLVEGNFIGTDITGTKKLPNGGNGVKIGLIGGLGGASNNTIGA